MHPMRCLGAALASLCIGAANAATVQVTVLAADGQPLADAVVLIEPDNAPSAGAAAAPKPVTARIDQQRMQFVPAVTLVPTGSTVRFTNLDRWEHHVRVLPSAAGALMAGSAGKGQELRMPGMTDPQAPPSAEIAVPEAGPWRLGCHLHGSMRGFIYVTDSPWAAKTEADGRVTLQGVPEGSAKVRVWHGEQVVDGAPTRVQLTAVSAFEVKTGVVPRRRR